MSTDNAMSTPEAHSHGETYTSLPFPPLKRSHIRHCAFDYWHPRFRAHTPKARLIPLTAPFVAYLRQDGIILPSEPTDDIDADSGIFSASDAERETALDNTYDDSDGEDADVADSWPELHAAVRDTIAELGGSVVPKLNWSAPKDATWISATNSLECKTANDVYLLLKSSDFVTHDLQHAYDGTVDDTLSDPTSEQTASETPSDTGFHLVLRKYFQLNPSLEFRCFVRNRQLLGICQRDLNHFDFLVALCPKLQDLIVAFFEKHIKAVFPGQNFAFDVYIPPPHERVWLVDFNPWDRRTDPLLFSWLELLTLPEPELTARVEEEKVIRIPIRMASAAAQSSTDHDNIKGHADSEDDSDDDNDSDDSSSDDPEAEINAPTYPIFRLVRKSDPEAYMFNTPRYSAHKMPRDVVDAAAAAATAASGVDPGLGPGSDAGTVRDGGAPGLENQGVTNADIQADPGRAADAAGGLREFAKSWKELLEREHGRGTEDDSSGDEA